jgi:hypothetical protein
VLFAGKTFELKPAKAIFGYSALLGFVFSGFTVCFSKKVSPEIRMIALFFSQILRR